MADEDPQASPMLQKAGAVVTLLGAIALAWVAIDTLRSRREDTPPDDEN
jgi:threonine/homoserine/homoserine lactone efflux protein